MNILSLLRILFSKKSLIILSVFLLLSQSLIIYYLNSKLDKCKIQNSNNLKVIENLQKDLESSNAFLELNKKQCDRLIYDLDYIDFAFSKYPKNLDTSNKLDISKISNNLETSKMSNKLDTSKISKNISKVPKTQNKHKDLKDLKDLKNLMESIK